MSVQAKNGMKGRTMTTGGKREEIDAKITGWECELERWRVALARAPESAHTRYSPSFAEAYRAKEVVKSRWEAVRGVYEPEPAAIRRFQEALEAMEAAWAAARPVLADLLKPEAV
jgi:hypothetical protein